MKEYNVLWIDDEWEKQDDFITNAEQEDIHIKAFTTSKDGIKALKENINYWDAIVLDAKCWNGSTHETASTKGMHNSIKEIEKLQSERYVPYFIYTGQPDLQSNEEFKNSLVGAPYYEKGTQEEKLLRDIVKKADENDITKLKFKYDNVCSFAEETSPYLLSALLKVLQVLEDKDYKNTSVSNDIRKILEWIMESCNTKNILPIKFSGSNLSECSRFLGRNDMQIYVPTYVQRSLHSCIEITNNGSHGGLDVNTDLQNGNAPYLIRSTIFELLNILIWYKNFDYTQNHIDYINKIYNNVKEEYTENFDGVVEQDINGNYHCGDYLLKYHDGENLFGKQITVIASIINKKSSSDKYPNFITKYDL